MQKVGRGKEEMRERRRTLGQDMGKGKGGRGRGEDKEAVSGRSKVSERRWDEKGG